MTRLRSVALFTVAAALFAACADRRPDSSPTGPRLVLDAQGNATMGTCTTIGELNTLAAAVFGSGSPNVNSVLGKLSNLDKHVAAGRVADAQAQAINIVQFVRDKAAEGRLPGTTAQINAFINGVLCYAGLPASTFLIQPTDEPQIQQSSDGLGGVSLQGQTVGEPALLTITTLDPNAPPPLNTKLDKYATYTNITISSPLTKPAVVAICPTAQVPAAVRPRLRLGHQATAGFLITPAADGSFLTCTASTAQSRLPGWMRSVAALILPQPLYAALLFEGGVGGLASEFSPFGAVDPELSFSGGVGGLATEFQRKPASPIGFGPAAPDSGASSPAVGSAAPGVTTAPGGPAFAVSGGVCTEVSATVGTELEPECRPVITMTTHAGTILTGVPVAWAVTQGGGTIAPNSFSDPACGAYGSTAATATNAAGKAAVCWILGPEGGTNKATATPSAGGDAPAGVTFSPAGLTFTATGLKITPTVTATGGAFVFDNTAHPGSGSCSNGLTPALTYSSGTAPTDVGSHTLTVTCGAGSAVYNEVSATAAITISAATPLVTVTCPASVTYNGNAQTPCSATVTAPALSLTPDPSYSNNVNAGTATASVSYAASGNYGAASGSATFEITKAASVTAVTCPSNVTYTGSALAPCSASVTGAGGLNQALAVSYSNNVNAGVATASASFGGGPNHNGSSANASFTIDKAASTTTVSCSGATYTGGPQTPCTASATGVGGLNTALPVSYTNNVNAGTAGASAAYAGGPNHTASSGTATFTIAKAASVTTVSCPDSVQFTGSPVTPCTAAVTGTGGLSQAVTPVIYSNNMVGTATATATYPGGSNWNSSVGSATFAIRYVQVGCFSAPVYSVMPESKSAQRKGSNLPVKCTLRNAAGSAVGSASGSLTVLNVGTSAVTPPAKTGTVVLTVPNAFAPTANGNYSYGLDTSPLLSGNYYYVIANWNDGSKTEGWFLIR